MGGRRTGTEAGPATKGAARPEMAMHNARPDKFQEQIKRVLEFVVDACRPEGGVHRPGQGRVGVLVQEEPIKHDRRVSSGLARPERRRACVAATRHPLLNERREEWKEGEARTRAARGSAR